MEHRPRTTTAISLCSYCCVVAVRHMEERLTTVQCTFCNRPVRLDEYELNDLGEPAHEACLAERRKEEIKKRKATSESK